MIVIGSGIEIGSKIIIGDSAPPTATFVVIENTTDNIITEQGNFIIEEQV